MTQNTPPPKNAAEFKAVAAELIAEGHPADIFPLLILAARRELIPGLAKSADGIFNALLNAFPETPLPALAGVLRGEIYALGKLWHEDRPLPPARDPVTVWLRSQFAAGDTDAARGELMLVELCLLAKTDFKKVQAVATLYRQLRRNWEPGGIIIIARGARAMLNQAANEKWAKEHPNKGVFNR